MLFAASSWSCLRPRTENVFVELEAHAEERTAAGNVLACQISIMEARQIVAGGEPHIADQAIAGFKPHAILARGTVQTADRGRDHADVPLAVEVIHGAASRQLRGCGAGDAIVTGHVPLDGVAAGNTKGRAHLVIGSAREDSNAAVQRRGL